jgi:hypothetical protein
VGADSRFVRLRLDPADAGRPASDLDLVYVLPPPAGASRWQLALHPPRLHGPVFLGPVRWQIGVASGNLLLAAGDDARFDWRWGWQHGLLAPRPAATATEGVRGSLVEAMDSAVFGWQATAEPLTFFVVPRTLALLFGSLVVVALGLAAIRLSPAWRSVGAVGLAIVVACLAVLRPQAGTILLYAAEPGAAVLIALLFARWAAQRQYRRRVLFLPAFARVPEDGSGAGRNSNGQRLRREPTTIDAPQGQ